LQINANSTKWATVVQSQLSTSIDPLNWQTRYPLNPPVHTAFEQPR
jgi:hypothetical protein